MKNHFWNSELSLQVRQTLHHSWISLQVQQTLDRWSTNSTPKGYKPSPFFKMGRGEAETHFEKWTRLYIRGIARLQPKLIYIARCPISRMPTFLMGGLYLGRWDIGILPGLYLKCYGRYGCWLALDDGGNIKLSTYWYWRVLKLTRKIKKILLS